MVWGTVWHLWVFSAVGGTIPVIPTGPPSSVQGILGSVGLILPNLCPQRSLNAALSLPAALPRC